MTKKETIAKHWQKLVGKTPEGVCYITGWLHGYFPNRILDITNDYGEEILEKIDYKFELFNSRVGRFMPKSLRGIEDNNGWIKIETVEGLPINGSYLVVHRDSGTIQKYDFGILNSLEYKGYIVEKCSHYKPIPDPLKPLY
jgi:hypothetical protein